MKDTKLPNGDDARNKPTNLPAETQSELNLTAAAGQSGRPRRVLKWSGTLGIIGLVSALFVIFQAASLPVAFGSSFTNPATITINDAAAATPYPSNISVAGITGNITKVTVTLTGLTHGYPNDVDVLLVSPAGQKVVLMAGTGSSFSISNVQLTFDDAATNNLPTTSQISSGTYKPTSTIAPAFPAPAPAGPYGGFLSGFNGSNPNGTWSLYVIDSSAGPPGSSSISGGWSLKIDTADISVTDAASPNPVNAGSLITYTIGAANAGPDVAASSQVTTTTPANTTFVSVTPPGGWSCPTTPALGATGGVSCTNASFGVGSGNFTFVVKVNPTTAASTVITDTAYISSVTPDTNPANNLASAATTVSTSADLAVTKTDAPDPVTAGTNITYTVSVTNNGPSNAASVVLTDTVPTNTTFQSMSVPSGWSCPTLPAVGGTGLINCTMPSLGLTTTNFTLVVKVDPATLDATTISNTAAVSSATSDSVSGNNSATANTTVATSANTALSKTGSPSSVNAGSNITYSIVVTNTGPSNVTSAVVSDTIPANTTFQSLNFTAGQGWSCPTVPAVGGTGLINCTNSSYAITNSTFTLVVKVNPATPNSTTITNTATLSSPTPDPTPANNTGTATTMVGTSADVAISKTDSPDPVTAGTNITYNLTVTNNGPSNAASAIFTDTIPVSTTFQSLTIPPSSGWNCNTIPVGGTGQLNCTNPSFGITTTNFTLVVKVDPTKANGTTITNTATISSANPDPTPANNTTGAVVTTVNTSADLSVSKTDSPDPVNAGANLTYSIIITNTGPSNATNTVFTDTIPVSTTFQSLTIPPGSGWNCNSIPVGGTGQLNCTNPSYGITSTTFTLVVKVSPARDTGTNISNTATATSGTSDPTPGNNSATATTNVTTSADLQIAKVGSPNVIGGGDTLTYSIIITNTGPSNALSLVMSDTVPVNTTFQSLTPPAGWTCPTVPAVGGIGQITCNTPSLGVTSATITLAVKVKAGLANGTSIANTATIDSTTPDPSSVNNTVTANNGVNCDFFTVTNAFDDNRCGTFRGAVTRASNGQTITFTVSLPMTITLSGSGIIVPFGVTINALGTNPNAPCAAGGPKIIIDGTGIAGDGITLSGGDTILGIKIRKFGGRQLVAPMGGGNVMRCNAVSKT